MMLPILRYIILSGVRDKLYIGLLTSILLAFCTSIFIGSTAMVEATQTTTIYIAATIRILFAVGIILFVCLSLNRAFEGKEIEFIISKSISRQKFVLSYLLGFFAAIFLIFFIAITTIYLLCKCDKFGLLIWSLSIMSELSILICFAVLSSLILRSAFAAIMSSFGFYILARMMGIFTLAIALPQDISQLKLKFFGSLLKLLSVFFPRLDLFGQSQWLIYGISDFSNLWIILFQSLIYIPLLIFMAFHDFRKKQF